MSNSDNKSKNKIISNDIEEENNSLNDKELNFSKNNEDESLSDNEIYYYEHIKSVKDLKKVFYISRATVDGNCLFYSLSTATFGTDTYFNKI